MKADLINKKTDAVKSQEGLPIRYDLYYPEGTSDKLPAVLFLHGFKGFKDWGTFPQVCRHLAMKGFAVVAMNFSLNGIGRNKMEFTRLDLFSRETLSQDLEDVGSVIEALKQGKIRANDAQINTQNIGILGHSRGGQTAVAAAAEYDEIECLVSWSAVADCNARWSDKMINDWQEEGVTKIKNGRTGQMMPVKKVVYDDARENADRNIALNRVDELKMPSLFIHAEDDESVSTKNAEQLYSACSSTEKDLMFIPDTGHTFGGSHPFRDDQFPEPLQQALSKTTEWLGEYLK